MSSLGSEITLASDAELAGTIIMLIARCVQARCVTDEIQRRILKAILRATIIHAWCAAVGGRACDGGR